MRGKLSQILPWPPIQMYGRQRIMTNHDGGTFPYGRAALRESALRANVQRSMSNDGASSSALPSPQACKVQNKPQKL